MKWDIAKKFFATLIVIGIIPMIIFSFLTITAYQNLIEKQSDFLEQHDKELAEIGQPDPEVIQIQTLLIFTILSILVIFFSIILVRKFIYPIKKLEQFIKEIKKGNLDTKIKIRSGDEFEELASSFNEMSSQLNEKMKQLEKSKESIKKAYTDLKEQREKSEREKHKVSTIISNFSDPIIMVDNEKRISLFNFKAEEVFNLKKEDKGKKIKTGSSKHISFDAFKDIIKAPFDSKIIEKKRNILVEEVSLSREGKRSGRGLDNDKKSYKDGDIFYKITTIPVCDESNNCFGYMKIFYNLTREKILDELKSEFVSIAAHQLRTPLTAIKWSIKTVLDEHPNLLDKYQEELLKEGYRSNERIIKLVNNMLNVSRIEEGKLEYSFGRHDINEVVDPVIGNFKKDIEEKNIEIKVEKSEQPTKVYVDKEKMELVLQNLLENAVKFTPKGGRILLKVEQREKNVIIKVKDNGVGIPKESQNKLFTKFFRAKNVIQMETEGSGLGLFIIKSIIEKHDGKIEYQSEEGKGTEFIITLPKE